MQTAIIIISTSVRFTTLLRDRKPATRVAIIAISDRKPATRVAIIAISDRKPAIRVAIIAICASIPFIRGSIPFILFMLYLWVTSQYNSGVTVHPSSHSDISREVRV